MPYHKMILSDLCVNYFETFLSSGSFELHSHVVLSCCQFGVAHIPVRYQKYFLIWWYAQEYLHGAIFTHITQRENMVCKLKKVIYGLKQSTQAYLKNDWKIIYLTVICPKISLVVGLLSQFIHKPR